MTEQRFPALHPSFGALVGLAAIFALWLGLQPAVAAGIPPVFVVASVPVDTTAANAVAARNAALAAGERAGLRRLFERLTASADWSRLPNPAADTVTGLVTDFEVTNERSSAVRYIATYTFRFNANGVRHLLQGAGLAFTELASKAVVIVPLLKTGDTAALWGDVNPWREAWRTVPGKYGLVPWVVPSGDAADIQALDAAAALAPRPEQLQALSQRHGNGDVVVAQASPGDGVIDIVVTRYSPEGVPDATTTRVTGAKLDPALFQAGVIAAQRALEDEWKKLTLSPNGNGDQEAIIEVTVPAAHPGDWAVLRNRLARVPQIRAAETEMITRAELRLKLWVKGDPALLQVALAQQDLVLTPGTPYQILRARKGADLGSISKTEP